MENDHDNDKQYKRMQDEIKELQSGFHMMSGDVKNLSSSQTKVQESVDSICGSLEKMSKSIEEMTNRLTAVSEEQQRFAIESMLHKGGSRFYTVAKKTLRKLAVGTIGTAMLLGEYSAEKLACAREEMEDIIAEASYNNKMRKQNQNTAD